MEKLYEIYKCKNCSRNPTIIFTFPTSNGKKKDILNLDIVAPILNEDILFVLIQTDDDNCFYNSSLSDNDKINNLNSFCKSIDKLFEYIFEKYPTSKTPILMGCSMGGYYAQLFYMRHPNKFNCISLGGMCNIEILDINAEHLWNGDKIINYYENKKDWDKFNPYELDSTRNTTTKLISCFGGKEDGFLIKDVYNFHQKLKTWNYIKIYDLYHNHGSWYVMINDIFKGSSTEFHDFRMDFYKK